MQESAEVHTPQMNRLGTIITSVIASLITALVVVWFSEALVQIVPSPQRLALRVQNALSASPSRTDESFRIVLCWLENDWSGNDTRNVEDAFSDIALALDIVNHFARQGAPILPVHDSFLVQARYQDELRHVMNQAYAHHTGGFTCPIKP